MTIWILLLFLIPLLPYKMGFVWQSLSYGIPLVLKINAFKNYFAISSYYRLRLTFNKKYNFKEA